MHFLTFHYYLLTRFW